MKEMLIAFVVGVIGSIVATLITNNSARLYGYFIQYIQILNFLGICTVIGLMVWLISKSSFDR